MKRLNIGRDFSEDPSGRFLTDKGGNGEKFRENYFKVAIQELEPHEKLEIILDDGVESYGSSFLSEGFAGMVKYGYISSEDLLNKIELRYTDKDFKFYKDKIITYIKNAEFGEENYVPTMLEGN